MYNIRIILAVTSCLSLSIAEAERPNILWITSEDNAAHWLGCYGNDQASTPRLVRLAAEGNLFRHAYSNAPVCAVARSTILTGVHAPSMGTQHMRSRYAIPEEIKAYVTFLRGQGYYCTNASKTDYNFKGNDRAIWDDCSDKAHYRKRPDGRPFFAIFNLTVTHESSLFPGKRGFPTCPRCAGISQPITTR
jgi:N-sulfoglucosamine sulfohydrolase